jgi:acyl carrier protein
MNPEATSRRAAENGNMASGRAELLGIFQKTATEIVEREFKDISEKTAISDLGIDSLGMLEIVGSMERELKIQLPDEALAGIQTVEDLITLVQKKQEALPGQAKATGGTGA